MPPMWWVFIPAYRGSAVIKVHTWREAMWIATRDKTYFNFTEEDADGEQAQEDGSARA
jgi:hypothetical protein